MPNNCLSVLYKHIIQVENKNVVLKVGGGGHKHTIAPQSKKWGRHMPPLAHTHTHTHPLPTPVVMQYDHAKRKTANLGMFYMYVILRT